MQTRRALLLLLAVLVATITADISVHCLYTQIVGRWKFYMTPPLIPSQNQLAERTFLWCNRTSSSPLLQNKNFMLEKTIELELPNKASLLNSKNEVITTGTWTMIYDQGFEVIVDGKKFFAFNKFKVRENGRLVTSYCGKTQKGWYHDDNGDTNYGCYYGVKMNSTKDDTLTTRVVNNLLGDLVNKKFKTEHEMVKRINEQQKGWRAHVYSEYETMSMNEMMARAGAIRYEAESYRSHRHRYGVMSSSLLSGNDQDEEEGDDDEVLPTHWDWRNVSGVNYDSPVRNQGACGSCYVFATVSAIEARIRIQTKNKVQVQLAPQDVVSCSLYSQLCHGGFPYLAAKYIQDFYLVPETCFPYKAQNLECGMKCKNPEFRVRVQNYSYIGGYYGGTHELAMMREIYKHGPIPVSFVVYPDFNYYRSGIYSRVKGIAGKELTDGKVNPWEPVSHSVTIVGYGEEDGVKYWVCFVQLDILT
jgi:cathepsin C